MHSIIKRMIPSLIQCREFRYVQTVSLFAGGIFKSHFKGSIVYSIIRNDIRLIRLLSVCFLQIVISKNHSLTKGCFLRWILGICSKYYIFYILYMKSSFVSFFILVFTLFKKKLNTNKFYNITCRGYLFKKTRWKYTKYTTSYFYIRRFPFIKEKKKEFSEWGSFKLVCILETYNCFRPYNFTSPENDLWRYFRSEVLRHFGFSTSRRSYTKDMCIWLQIQKMYSSIKEWFTSWFDWRIFFICSNR